MTGASVPHGTDWSALPLIYFIRHGQTDWNAESRLQGQSDIELNDVGRGQALRNGERLRGLVGDGSGFAWVSSPMKRACETMQIVREAVGLPRDGYTVDQRLKEIHFGDWQGFTYPELEARTPGFAEMRERDKWNIVPPGQGAESYALLSARIEPWFRSIETPTVCVSHGGVMRSILRLVTGASDADASHIGIPQDRIARLQGGTFEWL